MSTTITPHGFAPSLWRPLVDRAPVVDVRDLVPGASRLTVLGAHPDDETIGAGRLVAGWAAGRGPVRLVSLTAGEACLVHVGVHLDGLADRRRSELTEAARRLGAAASTCWSVPDGAVADAPADVVEAVRGLVTGSDVVAAPWRHDPHPDHAALGALAARLCADHGVPLLEYPVWTTYWQEPVVLTTTGTALVVVEVDDSADHRRHRALAAYESQQLPLRADLGPVVPAPMLEHHDRQLLLVAGTGSAS